MAQPILPEARMQKIFFPLLILFSSLSTATASIKTINDSLVQNLDCRNLSINKIYRSIREDAFNESRNIPVKNWGFKSGIATIAGCWSLSRTQRMFSYLARYNTSSDHRMDERVSSVLDMIRGATLVSRFESNAAYLTEELPLTDETEYLVRSESNQVQPEALRYCEKKLSSYKVFEIEDSSFSENQNNQHGLWAYLQKGYTQYFLGKSVLRNFRQEVQAQQAKLFYRINNLKMIWKKGDRPDWRNYETAKQLTKNLSGKRLTLLNLRMDRARQHVVMAKSFRKVTPEIYEFKVYDSNAPRVDSVVFYNWNKQAFFSPEILNRFKDPQPYRKLGVFIVGEDDRDKYEIAMLKHYRELCK